MYSNPGDWHKCLKFYNCFFILVYPCKALNAEHVLVIGPSRQCKHGKVTYYNLSTFPLGPITLIIVIVKIAWWGRGTARKKKSEHPKMMFVHSFLDINFIHSPMKGIEKLTLYTNSSSPITILFM